jgi:hypothetical protein
MRIGTLQEFVFSNNDKKIVNEYICHRYEDPNNVYFASEAINAS